MTISSIPPSCLFDNPSSLKTQAVMLSHLQQALDILSPSSPFKDENDEHREDYYHSIRLISAKEY